ncbi:MAG TPA: hypothetical protein VGC76_09355 [Pyrinomonadaceae bacterium]|jgi:hypothetical protein
MNRVFFINTFLIICFGLLATSCSQNRAESSDKLVERLNSQIKLGNFEQIYVEAGSTAKNLTLKEGFLKKMISAVNKMKEVDESLSWQKGETVVLSNADIAADLYLVHRKIERNGKKLDIKITITLINQVPKFLDLCVSPSELTTVESETCVTNASKKI